MAAQIANDALVVRGGLNLPESFIQGSGVEIERDGKLQGVSVNAAAGLTSEILSAPIGQTGYPGIPNRQIGVTTVGAIRAAGGEVESLPTRRNPNHATLSGLTPKRASELFRPTIQNPSKRTFAKEELR